MDRRGFLIGAGCATASVAAAQGPKRVEAFGGEAFRLGVAELERESGGRLGVAVLDTGSGRRFAWRGDERFPMCSTFKLPLAAAVLARVDRGRERLDRRIAIGKGDLVAHAPFAETRVGGDASVAELCEATTTLSDNPAANLLLATMGGPAGWTAFVRAAGDPRSRLDRIEPKMNDVPPGDPRDTTTPVAMLELVRRLTLGTVLSPASRARLVGWMVANKTGDRRLRAGLPPEWRVGDKTGASGKGSDNDVALIWPGGRPPLLVSAYITGSPLSFERTNAVHARLGALVATAYRA